MTNISEYNGIYCGNMRGDFLNYMLGMNYMNSIAVNYLPPDHDFFKGKKTELKFRLKKEEKKT